MNIKHNNLFKKGSQYSRKDIGWILLPETGRLKEVIGILDM